MAGAPVRYASSLGDEEQFLYEANGSWSRKARVAGLVGGVMMALAGTGFGAQHLMASTSSQVEQKFDVETIPKWESCVPDDVDCSKAMCCKTSGHRCYEKDSSSAFCRKEGKCVPGIMGTCKEKGAQWRMKPAVSKPGTSLFCFAMYVVDMGPPGKRPPNHQLELLRTQHQASTSIFGCPEYAVYSDVTADIGGGVSTKVVSDVDGDWHDYKRKDKPNMWANSMIYFQTWKAIKAEGSWSKHDWVVKVDPWSVFMPQRLVDFLATQSTTATGNYYETCEFVQEGAFGALEVTSNKAFGVFLERLDECKANLKYGGGGDWKYGPWGEDLFQQRCLDRHGIDKLPGYGLTNTGTCPNNRPKTERTNTKYVPSCYDFKAAVLHPFRDTKGYFACLGTTTNKDYSNL